MSSTLHVSTLTIAPDARHFFSKISHLPWAMLLDSGSSDHGDANYDIIVFTPKITLTTQSGITTMVDVDANTTTTSEQNPFDLIELKLNICGLSGIKSELPFSGGAVGHFSYDLGRYCEELDDVAQADIDLPEMAVGIYQHAIVFDHKHAAVKLVSRATALQHQAQIQHVIALAMTIPASVLPGKLTAPWRNQITFSQYNERFNRVQDYLRQGDCYQINLTQRFQSSYVGNEYDIYLKLAKQNNTPFSAFIRLTKGAIISVSPERFIQCRGGEIEAKPIKGTRPRSNDSAEDKALVVELLNSEKDQSENLMIVDLLRNDIGRCALPGSVTVPTLFAIESFKSVHHLVSTVLATLPDNISPLTLLKGAFPGGSITGAPKIRAMNIIDELEPHRRSIYCGSIGYISADRQMDTNITIRTLLCLDSEIYCWAGGGIVADSNVNDEYQECFDKVASILPLLAP